MGSERAARLLGHLPPDDLDGPMQTFLSPEGWVCFGLGGMATDPTQEGAKQRWVRGVASRGSFVRPQRPPEPIAAVRRDPQADLVRISNLYGALAIAPPTKAAPQIIYPQPIKRTKTGAELFAEVMPNADWHLLPPKVRGLYDAWVAA